MSDCSQCATQDACATCCSDKYPAASDLAVYYLIQHCVCVAGAPCANVCKVNGSPSPACQDQNAGLTQACYDCVVNQNACVQAYASSCQNDAVCAPILTCYNGC